MGKQVTTVRVFLNEYFTIRKSIFVYKLLNKIHICADQTQILSRLNSRKNDEGNDQYGAAINRAVRVLATRCFNDKA